MTTGGLGNGGNLEASIREQDRQAAFGQVGGPDAARFFEGLALIGDQAAIPGEL